MMNQQWGIQMRNVLRLSGLAATVAALALTAAPAQAATPNAQATARARILKPLVLTLGTNFNLGDIVLDTNPFSARVQLNYDGSLSCPAPLTCSGTTSVASYNARGTNNQVVKFVVPNVTLNGPGGATLLLHTLPADNLAPSAVAGEVLLTSSGAPGVTLPIGGYVDLTDTTVDGVYTGNFNVTADYM